MVTNDMVSLVVARDDRGRDTVTRMKSGVMAADVTRMKSSGMAVDMTT